MKQGSDLFQTLSKSKATLRIILCFLQGGGGGRKQRYIEEEGGRELRYTVAE